LEGPGGVGLHAALARAEAEPGHAELGELLFEVVHLARAAGIDPEAALRATAVAFRNRFLIVERLAAEREIDLRSAGADVVARLWAQAGDEGAGGADGAEGAAQASSPASA
jgi:uncharacterized protein YabN with tetrapyrrole methylase and pyrophosphatase domain